LLKCGKFENPESYATTVMGTSLIFPVLDVLAIKKATPQMRGTALGVYFAFLYPSLCIVEPIADWYKYQSVYLFGGISCMLAVLVLLFHRKSYRNAAIQPLF
jgi:hypothetical protein